MRNCWALLLLLFAAGTAAEPVTQDSPLVGGAPVTATYQEGHGLVTLSTGCSGSLLRNSWVITAAHCVDDPDPTMPGQFITRPENSVTLTANWNNDQSRQSVRIISFRPRDVAIVRVADPFSVFGSTTNYNRDVFRSAVPRALSIIVLGRGINRFAAGSGASATPSSGDGQYRLGTFNTTFAGDTFSYPSTAGQSIAGGDSGGPSFTAVDGNLMLVGVHSLCSAVCVVGQACGDWSGPGPAPPGYSAWRWVAATPDCEDAAIAPVVDDIDRFLGAFAPLPEAPPGSAGARQQPCASAVSRGPADIAAAWNDNGSTSVAMYPTTKTSFVAPSQWLVRNGGWGDGVKWAAGDFNGDGRADLAAVWNNGGTNTLSVRQSTGNTFITSHWLTGGGGWIGSSAWLPGDFNGDGFTDLAAAWNDNGSVSVAMYPSNGTSFLAPTQWLVRDGGWGDEVKWAAGDFNDDGRADLAAVWNNGGTNTLTVRQSTGSTFRTSHWLVGGGGWIDSSAWLPGDFNGDGFTDLAAAWNDNGSVSVAVYPSAGTSFQAPTQWLVRAGGWGDEVKWTASDFNGDGRADLASVWNNGGTNTLTVRQSTGSTFSTAHWATNAGGWIGTTAWCSGQFTAPAIDRIEKSVLDALAAKGNVIAKEGPLAVELRNRQPEADVRRGFDIGMAAAEGQTLLGPGKQRIQDSLNPVAQRGYRAAVSFSLERNRNAELAATGDAIAAADPAVAEARTADRDVFYWLGFDIATGIFGDPASGARGNTATGPGSTAIRDALSAAGQRGFNAAVALHLSRNYRPGSPQPADVDPRAANGEAIANEDPLSVELRNRQPEGDARQGFDIGMAAAEGQTLLGPGKQRVRDSLSPAGQRGFSAAVTFALERNRNTEFAAKGAAIAEADPVVAQARRVEADVFYWLGFDIATGIFGDPALGAKGNTATGPGSIAIRDALSAAGQRGFNAAVALHLSRNYRN